MPHYQIGGEDLVMTHTSVTKMIRVMLVDEYRVVRSGLRLLIESQPGLIVVGEASGRPDALAVAERERPEVILLDLPGTDAIDLLPALLIVAREARILARTTLRAAF